jgi:L,D-transpeptidase-like protein
MPSRCLVFLAAIAVVGCGSPEADLDDPDLPDPSLDGPDPDPQSKSKVDPTMFALPDLTTAERAAIVANYDALDPTGIVPRGLLEDAIIYFDYNKPLIPKQKYIIVVDLSQYAGNKRFWMVDLETGAVEAHKTAHGDGSDPDNDGYATSFSNVSGSHKSSLGFYLTGELYDGTHPHSMRLDGLSPDGSPNGMANTNVRSRAIVVHEASYVSDSGGKSGRSNGCPALDPAIQQGVVNRIHDGTLMYIAKSALHPPIGRACRAIPTAGGVIDDRDACFVGGGPAQYLRHVTTDGVNDTLVWTKTTSSTHEVNFATWNLQFATAGRYRVEAFTAAPYAQSKQARYVIHAGSADHPVVLDQTAKDGYQSLGEFDFTAGAGQSVHVGDNTGEPGTKNLQLVFDAIRLTRI